jgi:hypothetical protein
MRTPRYDRPVTFPFAFFGAGEATYFEWAEVCVLFAQAPDDAVRAEIDGRVPPPLAEDDDSVEWDGPALIVGSGQFAHLAIMDTYPADPGDEDDLGERFPFAAPSRVTRFNEDIEAWLRYAHERCPIVAAYRREDFESGGTDLPAWHQWSLDRLEAVLSHFDPDDVARARATIVEDPSYDASGDGTTHYMLYGILDMAQEAR